ESRGKGRVGVVLSMDVDVLHGGDRTFFRRGDVLLQFTHFVLQVGRITPLGWRSTELGRYFCAGLCEAEDVVDEEQYVLALFIAEILCDGQSAQRHAQARTGWLVHLAEDHCQPVDYLRFLHFMVEVVALAGALAYACKDA